MLLFQFSLPSTLVARCKQDIYEENPLAQHESLMWENSMLGKNISFQL